jgi:hypothetical protein
MKFRVIGYAHCGKHATKEALLEAGGIIVVEK